jgi:hypothetical protein
MAGEIVVPSLGAKAFNCPHCGAMAHQTWYSAFLNGYDKDGAPWMADEEMLRNIQAQGDRNAAPMLEYLKKKLSRKPFTERGGQPTYLNLLLDNVYVSRCFSCDEYAIWVGDELAYPKFDFSIPPNADMPDDVKADFLEAASIVAGSARGAAALLRLCIQKIVIGLGGNGENLNYDIGQLVEQRVISPSIQQALDIVRVVGNNAVHPGVIDLKDNKGIAGKLFGLVNVIVETTISGPKHIKDIYESVVPESARAAIEKRDAPKLLPRQKDGESD